AAPTGLDRAVDRQPGALAGPGVGALPARAHRLDRVGVAEPQLGADLARIQVHLRTVHPHLPRAGQHPGVGMPAPALAVPDPPEVPSSAPRDPSDEAMCARARERFTGDRGKRVPRRKLRHAAMPNLIIIGGLKCGTTSIHHYLGLHPEIQMSKPKELNFFVEELNWDLGLDWYGGRFDDRFAVRGESSPHYTN